MNRKLVVLALVALVGCQQAGSDEGEIAVSESDLTSTSALFVVGKTPLGAADEAVRKRIAAVGLTPTVKLASAATSADATGKALVVVSSTVTSGDVNTKFKKVTVPVVTWESAILDDMAMTKTVSTTDFGTKSGQTTLDLLVPATDPMAVGLAKGNYQVVTGADTFSWGRPASSAVKVASVAMDATRLPIFRYEKGVAMVNGFVAPERRVALFLGDASGAVLTVDGINLLDAALRWAAHLPVKKGLRSACAAAGDCAGNQCADGVCCDGGCTGTCTACALPGKVGLCTAVPEGPDPKGQCGQSDASTCGNDGFCDGKGACRKYAAGTVCGPGMCSGSTESSAKVCDGKGTCQPGAAKSCGNYVCNYDGLVCRTTCFGNANCVSGAHCLIQSCITTPPCRVARAENLAKTGGFDSNDETFFGGWNGFASNGWGMNISDAEGCDSSASLSLTTRNGSGGVRRCFPVLGDTRYYYGGSVMTDLVGDKWQASCGVDFHASADCSGTPLAESHLDLSPFVMTPYTWTSFAAGTTTPMGTASASFHCGVTDTATDFVHTNFDLLFLATGAPGF